MTAKNDITGDSIKTKPATDAYRNKWDAICWDSRHNPPTGYKGEYKCPGCGLVTQHVLDISPTL